VYNNKDKKRELGDTALDDGVIDRQRTEKASVSMKLTSVRQAKSAGDRCLISGMTERRKN